MIKTTDWGLLFASKSYTVIGRASGEKRWVITITRDAYKLPSEFGNIKDWVRILAQYREPNHLRSWTELSLTIGPFILIWAIAWWSLSNSY